jgi:DedD protein
MDRQLAERMVGAAVLLTVLVLVVPALLDGGRDEPSGRADAPLPPVLESAPIRTIRIEGQDDRGPPVPEARVPAPVLPPADSPAPEPTPAEPATAIGAPAPGPEPVPASAGPPLAAAVPPSDAAPVQASVKPPPAAPAPAGDWVVQLGSFANGANARRLAGQVRDKGFAATVSETGSGSARRYRVRSGPATTREVADRLAADIKAAGFQVTVVRP